MKLAVSAFFVQVKFRKAMFPSLWLYYGVYVEEGLQLAFAIAVVRIQAQEYISAPKKFADNFLRM